MSIASANLPAGTTITSISGNSYTLSQAATATGAAVSTTFGANVARTLTLTGTNTGTNEISSNLANSAGGGVLSISKSGTGTWHLSGTNAYTGATSVTAGTLVLANNSAAGSGSDHALRGNRIPPSDQFERHHARQRHHVLEHPRKLHRVAQGGSRGNLRRRQHPHQEPEERFHWSRIDTTAKILAGTNSSGSEATLSMKFGTTLPVTPSNDAIRRTDIFTLSGVTELDADPLTNYTDTFVIQLSASELVAASGSVLGWKNGSDWVNAVTGNTGGTASYFAGSFTGFLNGNAFNPATMLGAYGFDSSGGSVWAVVNHTGSFTAVPEPTSALAGLLITAGLLRRRRK